MSFALDLEAFAQKTRVKLDLVVRKVVIDMTSTIVQMTPVDTGHARSNYFWGVQRVTTIDNSVNPDDAKRAAGKMFTASFKERQKFIKAVNSAGNGKESSNRAIAFATGLKAGGTVYLTNNLPYIMALEYGHSRQAPAGMARITVAYFQKIVDKAVQGLQ